MSTRDDSPASSSKNQSSDSEEKKPIPSSPAPSAENIKKPTSSEEQPDKIEALRRYLEKLGLKLSTDSVDSKKSKTKVLETLDFDGLIKHWKNDGFKNIITMVGAGISTSAGIPDFRSPESGLYHNLQKYNLPTPSAIFQLNYFRHNPKPFFTLAKELYPGCFKPTPCHYFIKMLDEKGLLLRHYTQNIDTLERVAGIDGDKMVEAHGTFFTNHCIKCKKPYSMEWAKEKIFLDEIPRCICGNIVKPDIVFFGENLPDKFYKLPEKDFKKCDLLIIMGTSLEVQPFASLIERTNDNCVRLLINREVVGRVNDDFVIGDGFYFGMEENTRDIALIGDCDDGVQKIAEALGFGDELTKLIEEEHKKIDEENKK